MFWRKWITSSATAISSRSDTRCTTSLSHNSRGAGALNAPTASAGLDNLDQSFAVSNTVTMSPTTVNETRVQMVGAICTRLQAIRSDRLSASRALHRSVLCRAARMPVSTRCIRLSTTSRTTRAPMPSALAPTLIYNDDTITFPTSGSRVLRVLVDGEFSCRPIQRVRFHADIRRERRRRRPIPTSAFTSRTSGRPAPSLTVNMRSSLRPAVVAND